MIKYLGDNNGVMISACSYGAKDCQNKYLFFEKEIASFLSHCPINIELKERDRVGNIWVC